jgi:AAA domain-containing protein
VTPGAEVRNAVTNLIAEPIALHPAEPPEASGSTQLLPFRTARELVAQLPAAVAWMLFGYVAKATLHELVGGAKVGGKSTFLAHLFRAILDGLPFLGRVTTRSPIVFLTEQSGPSLRELLARADLADRDDLVILPWRDARAASWQMVVDLAVVECRRIGASLLVVDALPQFAGIRGEAENDAGAALAAIEPLKAAADDGLAVIVVRHERKSGGRRRRVGSR